jgi:hypothetical protein
MVAFHIKKLGYSVTDLANLLHLSVEEFQSMYRPEIVGEAGTTSGFLRIVK